MFFECDRVSLMETSSKSVTAMIQPLRKAVMKNSKTMAAISASLLFGLFGICASAAAAGDSNKVTPGELIIDHPTLINLGFEWLIEGDDNRNAQVEVSYRQRGETQWKVGLPLLRLQGERVYQNQGVFDVVSPNMFAEAFWTCS